MREVSVMTILKLSPFQRSQRMPRRSTKDHRRSPLCLATQLGRLSTTHTNLESGRGCASCARRSRVLEAEFKCDAIAANIFQANEHVQPKQHACEEGYLVFVFAEDGPKQV